MLSFFPLPKTNAELQICKFSPVQPLIGKSGRLYICVVVWSLVVCHAGDSSDVTLAFEDDQVIPPTFWVLFGYFLDTF